MALWEIINPSDPVTIHGDDLMEVALATVFMGGGQYAAEEVDGDRGVPLFLFGGHDEWFAKRFLGRSVTECLEAVDKLSLAEVLDSAAVVRPADRGKYDAAIKDLDGDERIKWRNDHHEKARSSMNDICGRAWKIAQHLRHEAKAA